MGQDLELWQDFLHQDFRATHWSRLLPVALHLKIHGKEMIWASWAFANIQIYLTAKAEV